ncbi:MAG TPA: FG-GAP repeat domain-containing protein, partial [Candidatus Wujingus californicus]|uniref:FG-GAP repeat domain-containing protein n=1 Tax=Candidatus Wujingus californicus TaxID=3367618 RepID=UPI0040292594
MNFIIPRYTLFVVAVLAVMLEIDIASSYSKTENNLLSVLHLEDDTEYSGGYNKQPTLSGDEFAAIPAFYAGLNPTSGVACDFDGDGFMDIATTNKEGVLISINTGNGFKTHADYNIAGLPVGIATSDVNADGYKDLVIIKDLTLKSRRYNSV